MDPKDIREPKLPEFSEPLPPFTRPRYSNQPTGSYFSGLWLEIFLGVFLALAAHSALGIIYIKWELRQTEKLVEREVLKLQEQLRRAR